MPFDSPVRRSLLFTPGVRPDRFAKALSSGADVVCIDLEDAVAPTQKAAARATALAFVADADPGGVELMVRINSVRCADGLADLLGLLEAGKAPTSIMVPKVNTAEELRIVDEVLGAVSLGVVPLVETAEGLANARAIAKAPRVTGIMLGGVDLSADLRCALAWEPLLYARGVLVAATAEAGIDVIDVPYLDVNDEAGLRDETARAAAMGFTGRSAIHPKQIATINAVMTPSAEQVAYAERVIEAFDAMQGGVALLDGKLIELPVAKAMRRVLAVAARAGVA